MFCFGVAKVKKLDAEEEEGVRLGLIDYTSKTMCTIKTFRKHMNEECKQISTLTGESNSIWMVNDRPKDEIWMEDDVSKMKGAGGKKGKTLCLAGIKLVSNLKAISDDTLPNLKERCAGISVEMLKKWKDLPVHPGACPHRRIDYRRTPNPYLAKYGSEDWEKKCKESVFMKKYMCVTELVERIHDETRDAFVGTNHEEDWFFYHDALSLMTAKTTVAWMKRKGYYKRWLIPQLGCNGNTIYDSRPVGNSPEWMPLDNALNNDIHQSLSLYCAITSHLPADDPRKFSMATPKTIVRGIERLWVTAEGGNVPSSDRIKHDCDKVLRAFGTVFRNGGKMVPGLANRSGHRNHVVGRNNEGWGGARVKNVLVEEIG